ncbi:MAG: DUF2304 domain-containing protein [Candidatus Magasanikbacteria bacterium]
MLILFQILVVIFSLFAIIGVISKKREGLLGPKGTAFWFLFWVAVSAAVLWPNGLQIIADHIGIGRGVDVVIYIALALLFYIIFRMNIKIEGLKRDLTKVVRDKALEDAENG